MPPQKYIMNKIKNTVLIFGSLLLLTFSACKKTGGAKTLKLAHALPTEHPVHKAMEYMGKVLLEKSGGKLGLEIYPSQQLGTERQCLELLQIGSLAMTKVSAAVMENFSPRMRVVGLPYLFRDREHGFHFQDSELGKQLLVEGEGFWLRGLVYFDAGQRSFYTKTKPVHVPADLKNQKIRVMQSKTAIDMVKALGGSPTPISWGELYTALQQGIVDGAENNPPSFYTSRHYEVCKYYTLDEHTSIPDLLVVGTVAWNRLSPQEQTWLQEAADEAKFYQRKLWAEAEEEALREVQKAGVEIIRPDKSVFSEKAKPVLEAFKEDAEIYELIKEIQAIK